MSKDEDPPAELPSEPGTPAKPDFSGMARRLASLGPNLTPVLNSLAEARKRSEQQRLDLAKRLAAPPRSLTEGFAIPVATQMPNINLDNLEHPSIETNRQIRALRTEMEVARDHLGSVAEHQQKQVELVDGLLDAFLAAAATARSGAEESKEIAVESRNTAASGVKIAKLALWAAVALGLTQIVVASLPYLLKNAQLAPSTPAPRAQVAERTTPQAQATPVPALKAAPAAPKQPPNVNP